jgi:hypothetical protein
MSNSTDHVALLGLDSMPNVRISATGSWLENDITGEDD